MTSPKRSLPFYRRLIPLLATALVLVVAVIFHRPFAAWFTGAPVGRGATSAVETTRAGALSIQASLQPDPPRQQGNTLWIRLEDAGGGAVQDAQVKVTYSMPAMGSMPEMRGEAKVSEEKDGQYAARFDLSMGGTWTLDVGIASPRGRGTARYTMTVGSEGLTPVAAGAADLGAPPSAALMPSHALPDGALAKARAAFDAYEGVRARLARDQLDGAAPLAATLGSSLAEAGRALGSAPSEVSDCFRQAAEIARGLESAKELERARAQFSELSRFLMALATSDPRLQQGWHAFECPMVAGFRKWFQRGARLENPYMGTRMPTCGSPTDWSVPAAGPPERGAHEHADGDEIAYYTCSMHPSVRQEGPGTCPICSMDLTPVTKEAQRSGVIFIEEARRQLIGVKTAPVERKPMSLSIRALGRVTYDESKLVDVTLRVKGWIQHLRVSETGQPVKAGQRLFDLYSPELYAGVQEYLLALNRESAGGAGDSLVRASRKRLELWGLSEGQIDAIAKRGEPSETVPILAPATGFVIEKNVVEGAAVEPGQKLYRIAPLDKVWIETDVYESDLPHVKTGQRVLVTLPYLPGRRFEGTVNYVYPYLAGGTRTGKVRVELPNPGLELKPDMYADVSFQIDAGGRLQVPASAVIYTGPRRLVFVDLGEGRLKPQEVEVGLESGDAYEIVSGLKEGDRIVTSGNFLVAAESRIRSAAEYWSGGDQ